MKKSMTIFVLGLILISFSMNFVSAASTPVEVINGVITGATDILKPVLVVILGEADSSEMFFTKVMLLIVIFAVIFKSLKKIPFFNGVDSEWIPWVVGLAISFVSIRWIQNAEVLQTILLPYSALGIALTAGIPFVLYFFMTIDFQKTMRKISWIFFIAVFALMWGARAKEVGNFGYIYLITAIAGVVVLLMDGTIQKIMHKNKIERVRNYANQSLLDKLEDKIRDADDRFAKGIIDGVEHERRVKDARKKINHLKLAN